MKKNKVLLLALALMAFQLNAQFLRTYNPGTTQETYSMRGYDLSVDDGKYYYTAGNKDEKVIFEVDPSDGSIVTPSTKIATFDNTGSLTGIGKNSVAVAPYFHTNDPFQPPCCFNVMYLTGGKNPGLGGIAMESHGVYDNGTTFNSYVRTSLLAQPGSPTVNSWLLDAEYSDQVTYMNNRYMVGRNHGHAVLTAPKKMFVVKQHNGYNANISVESVYATGSSDYPDIPTRTINDPNHGIMTAFGGSIHDGANYTNDPVLMDPGMWWVDHNMNTTVHKTYHNASNIPSENFGVAQSVINVNEGQSNQHSLIVTSGHNPTASASATFPMGRWTRKYFHILKDWDYTGVVTEALRLSFIDLQNEDDPYGTFYSYVQVGDIVEVEDGFLIVGSVLRTEAYDAGGISAMDEYDQVFMVKLMKPAAYPIGNLTFGYAKLFRNFSIDPLLVTEVQANRVKVIDGEVYIIGSYADKSNSYERTPILIKTDIDNQMADCSIPLEATLEELSVYEIEAENEQIVVNPTHGAKRHDYGTQILAPSAVECVSPAPADYALGGISIETMEELDVFPNPANDQITISGMTEGNATIVVVDLKGKTIFEYSGNVSSAHNLNISSLDNGVYFLQITQGEQKRSMKLIKN